MRRKRTWISVFVVVVTIIGGVSGAVHYSRTSVDPAAANSPAPFSPVDDDYPRILLTREEPPKSDEQATDEYREYRRERKQYILETGAIARATPKEQEAVRAERYGNYAKARNLACEVLEKNSESIPALIALAGAKAFGDGDLPRGLFLIRQARQLCEKRGHAEPNDADAREWYLRALDYEYSILGSLDRREEQLAVVELIESIYQPMPWRKTWPLMKLHRFDEARQQLKLAKATGHWTVHVLNTESVIAAELQDRDAALQAARDMTAQVDESPVLWSNYGLDSLGGLRLQEAESAFLRSVDAGEPDFSGTAYTYLSVLYLQQGRVTEAVDAIKDAMRHRGQRDPHTLQQDQATADLNKVMLMLTLGRSEDALRLAKGAYDAPDRGGSTSNNADVLMLSSALAYEAALQSRIAELKEEGNSVDAKLLQTEQWVIARRVRKQSSRQLLISTLRPYLAGGPHLENGVASWLRGGVHRFFPPGVAAEAIRQAREVETHAAATPYLDATEAEVRLAMRDDATALQLARKALEKLPVEGEKLLRARVAAVAAAACMRLGNTEVACGYFQTVLRDFPNVLRLLDIAIPVRITADGHVRSRRVANQLRQSARFVDCDNCFTLKLQSRDGGLHYQLMPPNSTVLVEGDCDKLPKNDETTATACRAIYQQIMSPDVDLSQLDLQSLDSSPSGVRGREVVGKLLEEIAPTQPAQ